MITEDYVSFEVAKLLKEKGFNEAIKGNLFSYRNGYILPCWCLACDCVLATKEQCGTLLKAMTDAGYTFDFEKKELELLITNGGDFESENCEQKPTEWSEEDEKMMRGILAYISCSGAPEGFQEWYDWFKSLKTRITWKPSKGQMNTLNLVVSDYYHACTKECDEKAIVLKSILEQLKQL